MAWMSNGQYALFIPTDPWRGAMTLPRELSLRRVGDDVVVVQRPVDALEGLRAWSLASVEDAAIAGESDLLDGVRGRALDIVAEIDPGDAGAGIYATGGEATVRSLDVWALRSIWRE